MVSKEGAVVGYNPTKRGRPSHNYHSCFMGNTRLALTVEVNHGNQHTANVKKFITKLFNEADWVNAGHRFEGAESTIKFPGHRYCMELPSKPPMPGRPE